MRPPPKKDPKGTDVDHPRTMAEKLLSRAAGKDVCAGDIAICTPSHAMGTDGSIPMAIDYLAKMGRETVSDAAQLLFAMDHYGISSGPNALALQAKARKFAHEQGIRLFDVGDGIGHQLLIEEGIAAPGRLVVGADSHATSYGALNCFGTGIGSSDLAGVMFCGQLWLEVPKTIHVHLTGRLPPGVSAKDVALVLARRMGADGANYMALEFGGPGVATMDMDDRIVLSNMAVEIGAKAGIFPFDAVLEDWMQHIGVGDYVPIAADEGAHAARVVEVDLSSLTPQIALPHRVDNVTDLDDQPFTPVDVVYLGTCTGGRMRDYEEALEVITKAGHLSDRVQVVVTPASGQIYSEMKRIGMLDQFRAFGARIELPGCGACCGTCGTIPSNGQKIISSANRNFRGRMGNAAAEIYLASSISCAHAAVRGGFGKRA
ncbi:aconitase/3-isopropylmalate dehydratase large subunit family protein [Roseovarius sp.]|uniref:3-isopropylmalate dehydratase large subunit n=2 Tax=Roseovarius sp. TaxID=1486281 RepID=UPI0032EEB4F7